MNKPVACARCRPSPPRMQNRVQAFWLMTTLSERGVVAVNHAQNDGQGGNAMSLRLTTRTTLAADRAAERWFLDRGLPSVLTPGPRVITDLYSPGLPFPGPEQRIRQGGRPAGRYQHRHR